MSAPISVLKLGSSILPDETALPAASDEIARWLAGGDRVVAVVSAFAGVTDELFAAAGRLGGARPDLVAALQATGEERSAALLALACAARGLAPALLDARSLGIVADGAPLEAGPRRLVGSALRRAIGDHPVVVVPGYVARHREGGLTLLGRGGSDRTALFLAHRLRARRCRLLKDVDGWYVDDPRVAGFDSPRYAALHWDDALAAPSPIVQDEAVALARRLGRPFEVGALGSTRPTVVGPGPTRIDGPPNLLQAEIEEAAPCRSIAC